MYSKKSLKIEDFQDSNERAFSERKKPKEVLFQFFYQLK